MNKLLLAFAFFLLLAPPVFAQSPYDQNNPSNPYGNGMALYDSNGNYHGQLGGNPYNPNSTSNPYGQYGNKYSPDSINNPYATFGTPTPTPQRPNYTAPKKPSPYSVR